MTSITGYLFSSPTCEPCRVMKPALQELKQDFDSLHWVDVNTKADPQNIAGRYGITHVPSMVVVRDGNLIGKVTGTGMAEYYRILRQATR
jgi:thioredoxin 1